MCIDQVTKIRKTLLYNACHVRISLKKGRNEQKLSNKCEMVFITMRLINTNLGSLKKTPIGEMSNLMH